MVFPHFLFIIGVGFGGSLGTSVVIRRQPEEQTKESARRDGGAAAWLLCGHMFLLCGCGPYVSIMWGSAICFYYVALGHMFLLVGCGRGARPYVSIVWLWTICYESYSKTICCAICFHRLAPSQGRNLLALHKLFK